MVETFKLGRIIVSTQKFKRKRKTAISRPQRYCEDSLIHNSRLHPKAIDIKK